MVLSDSQILNTTVDSMLSMLRSWGIWGFNPRTNSSCSRAASLDAIPLAHSIAECPESQSVESLWFPPLGRYGMQESMELYIFYIIIYYIYTDLDRLWNRLRVCPKFLGPRWVDDREMICQPWNCLMGWVSKPMVMKRPTSISMAVVRPSTYRREDSVLAECGICRENSYLALL